MTGTLSSSEQSVGYTRGFGSFHFAPVDEDGLHVHRRRAKAAAAAAAPLVNPTTM